VEFRRFFDVEFWLKVWRATQRVVGLAFLIVLHTALHRLLELAVFVENPTVQRLASMISMAGFLVVYAAIMFDMIEIFVPWLLIHNVRHTGPRDAQPRASERGDGNE
jgi:hypothetical protein